MLLVKITRNLGQVLGGAQECCEQGDIAFVKVWQAYSCLTDSEKG